MKGAAPIIAPPPKRDAGAETIPVTVRTPGRPDEVWQMSAPLWLAFEAHAEARGLTVDEAVEDLLRKAKAEDDARKGGRS